WGNAFEGQAQIVRIVLDRRDAIAREQVGEHVHHGFAVLKHVRNAGRRAGVVLEHKELVGAGAHDVDADDVRVDAARGLDAHHFGQESRVLDDQIGGDAAGPNDLLAVIDIMHEGVERPRPLLDTGGDAAPFCGTQDPRYDVEWDQPLGHGLVAVDGKGDPRAAEQRFRLAALALQVFDVLALQPLMHGEVRLPDPTSATVHLVERGRQHHPQGFRWRLANPGQLQFWQA